MCETAFFMICSPLILCVANRKWFFIFMLPFIKIITLKSWCIFFPLHFSLSPSLSPYRFLFCCLLVHISFDLNGSTMAAHQTKKVMTWQDNGVGWIIMYVYVYIIWRKVLNKFSMTWDWIQAPFGFFLSFFLSITVLHIYFLCTNAIGEHTGQTKRWKKTTYIFIEKKQCEDRLMYASKTIFRVIAQRESVHDINALEQVFHP